MTDPRLPFRLRVFRGPPEHRQVHTHQRPGRQQDRHHLVAPADHATHHPGGHRAPRPRPADPRRHPRACTVPPARCSGSASTTSCATRTRRSTRSACASPPPTRRSAPRRPMDPGPGAQRRAEDPPLVGIVTKIDKVGKEQVAAQLIAVSKLLGADTDVVPVSATSGEQVEVLVDVLASHMEPGPAFYRTASSRTSRRRRSCRAHPRGRARGSRRRAPRTRWPW